MTEERNEFPTYRFRDDIDLRLRQLLAGTEWEARVAALQEKTPLEERLKLYQELRDAGAISGEVAFFLVSWIVQLISDARGFELYRNVYAPRFDAVRERYDIEEGEDDFWGPQEGPPEHIALRQEHDKALDALLVTTFQRYGEHKMGALYRTDPEEADARYQEGQGALLGEGYHERSMEHHFRQFTEAQQPEE